MSASKTQRSGRRRGAGKAPGPDARVLPAHDQIMQAARALFAERGFRDTTVRMIAQKARVNGAAVNYYFKSKDALYAAIFDEAFQKFGRPLGDLVGTVRDEASWRAALSTWFEFMLSLFLLDTPERALFRRLVAQERTAPTEFCRRIYDDVFLPVVDVLRVLLRMAMPDVPPVRFHATFILLLGTCACFMHRDPPWDELEIPAGVPREEWVRILRDEMVAQICARHSFQTNHVL